MKHTINRRGIQQVQMQPLMHQQVALYADRVALAARFMAPVSSGTYKASIEARRMSYRYARARVYAHDFKAFWIEYGAGPSPVRGGHPFRARSTLEEATKSVGLRWDNRYAGEP